MSDNVWLPGKYAYDLFESRAMEHAGINYEEAQQTRQRLDAIATKVSNIFGNVYGPIAHEMRAAMWDVANEPTRMSIAVGTLATKSWVIRSRPPREMFHFKDFDELEGLEPPNPVPYFYNALLAVNKANDEAGYVPSYILPWAVELYKKGTPNEKSEVLNSLRSLRFSHIHIDSEDGSDPHPVERYLVDDELDIFAKQQLLASAVRDSRTTMHKPQVWQSMLDATLQNLSDSTTHPFREITRLYLDAPSDDYSYNIHREAQRIRLAQRIAAAQNSRIQDDALNSQQVREVIRGTIDDEDLLA